MGYALATAATLAVVGVVALTAQRAPGAYQTDELWESAPGGADSSVWHPSSTPTMDPSGEPSTAPTNIPTERPSPSPTTGHPKPAPSAVPSLPPSAVPTLPPSPAPIQTPTPAPTEVPTSAPSTAAPTSVAPTTSAPPTLNPTTSHTVLFELYKHALSVKNGTAKGIRDFVNATITHLDPNFDLGCDGVKVNAYLMPYGPQLHWVDASLLSNDEQPVELWQDQFELLNGNMSTWNAFMHNKVQMFVSDMASMLQNLQKSNYSVPIMYRRSTNYTGHASAKGELAHVLFPIAGRIYELTAPVTQSISTIAATWDEWSEDECPASHRLDTDLDQYVTTYEQYVQEAEMLMPMMKSWANERGYYPPMLTAISVATEAGDDTGIDSRLVDDLTNLASIGARVEHSSDTCHVVRLSTVTSHGYKAPVRYVTNVPANRALETAAEAPEAAATTMRMTVAGYNSYIQETHLKVAGSYEHWGGWDHWMDQHIGLKYVGEEPCTQVDHLNGNLSLTDVAVGQRTTADYGSMKAVHWYTGYAGSLTWEYWVIGCDYGTLNHGSDVCACIASNNDRMFMLENGYNCTQNGLNDWLVGKDEGKHGLLKDLEGYTAPSSTPTVYCGGREDCGL